MAWNAAADEDRFRADITLGHQWVLWAARQLSYQGITSTVPDMQVRPEFGERRAFRDQGDLYVGSCRVEVRSLQSRFTTPGSWPGRFVRVDLVSVFREKKDAGLFLFISRPTRSILGLRLRKGTWEIQRGVFDHRRQVARDWVVVGRDQLMTFEATIQYLHEKQAGL